MGELPEYLDDLPSLCGSEQTVEAAIAAGRDRPVFDGRSSVSIMPASTSAFAVALHMHQPLIPAGDRPAHRRHRRQPAVDAGASRRGRQPQRPGVPLVLQADGGADPNCSARAASRGSCWSTPAPCCTGYAAPGWTTSSTPCGRSPAIRRCGRLWVARLPVGARRGSSTPVQDYRLHVRAWQHHFAAIFGLEALGRVRGFSPAEMALPNHPDVAYAFVKTLNDCGYQWLLVQEHTVELADGRPLERPHLPHRLRCTSSPGTPPRSWPWSRPRAATPSWSASCSPTTRPKA